MKRDVIPARPPSRADWTMWTEYPIVSKQPVTVSVSEIKEKGNATGEIIIFYKSSLRKSKCRLSATKLEIRGILNACVSTKIYTMYIYI